MADVAQLVRAPDCGPGGREFNSPHSPQAKYPVYGWVFCLGADTSLQSVSSLDLGA